jgi:hypothetical protein
MPDLSCIVVYTWELEFRADCWPGRSTENAEPLKIQKEVVTLGGGLF